MKRAGEIFKQAHRPDPNWPLDHRSAKHKADAKEAWAIKRKRDKEGWAPPNAKEMRKP